MKYLISVIMVVIFAGNSFSEPQAADSLQKDVLSAGGSETGSSNYSMEFTIGQSAANQSTSSSYSGSWGFWSSTAASGCSGICGDANNDGAVNVSDAIWIINYVFIDGPEPQPVLACGDSNGDASVNVSDAIWTINYVFVDGPTPTECSPGAPAWYNGDCCPFSI